MMLATKQSVRGRVRFQSVDPAGSVALDSGWIDNIILNAGMNAVADRYWANCFTSCALGDSATPTIVSGGATTASQSNVTVTLSGGSFTFTNTATDAGKLFRFSTGQVVRIVSVQSSTSATVNLSQIVASTTFSVYQTTQTALGNELVRSSTIFNGSGGCGTTMTPPGTVVMRRSFDFPVQVVGSAFYREVGLSWVPTAGGALFSRVVLPAIVEVKKNFFPRLAYEFTLNLMPAAPVGVTAVFSGWPIAPATDTDGQASLEDWGIAIVNNDGIAVPYRTVGSIPILANEPSALADVLVGLDTQALISPGGAVLNRWAAGSYAGPMMNEVYIPNSYTLFRTKILAVNEAVSTQLRVFSMGYQVAAGSNFLPVYTLLFDQGQTKSGAVNMGLRFFLRWQRDLS
jgi:hypothetical protein